MVDIASNLQIVRKNIISAISLRDLKYQKITPQLVAVSKFHPPKAVINAYEAQQRHFGENYVNELQGKANNIEILQNCEDIKWHFIGHLQHSNINKLVKVNNLHVVQTIDSERIANALDIACAKFRIVSESKLKVMVQVNTSQEEAKRGCRIENVSLLVKYILENCCNLQFLGLMTIGRYGYDVSKGPNPDFLTLKECQLKLSEELSIDKEKIQLSMGMSTDFQHAIELGSSWVRVGTAVFGQRPNKL